MSSNYGGYFQIASADWLAFWRPMPVRENGNSRFARRDFPKRRGFFF